MQFPALHVTTSPTWPRRPYNRQLKPEALGVCGRASASLPLAHPPSENVGLGKGEFPLFPKLPLAEERQFLGPTESRASLGVAGA